MPEELPVPSSSRSAFTVGVDKFEDLGKLPAKYAKELANLLTHYRAVTFSQNPEISTLEDLLKKALGTQFDVVHVLSHAAWIRSSTLMIAATGAKSDNYDKWLDFRAWLTRIASKPGDPMLVLLDVCYAGNAAGFEWLDDAERRVYVLAATAPNELAFEARFTRAIISVLKRIKDGDELGAHPSVEVLSLSVVKRAIAVELERLCKAENATPQRLVSSRHELDDHKHALFRNPRYRSGALDARRPVDTALATIADPILGEGHFWSRAAGIGADQETRWCHFAGRRAELASLSKWLDDPAPTSWFRLVCGSPGMGKSALLGVLACLMHPELNAYAPLVESRIAEAEAKPAWRETGEIAAVHARNRDTAEIVRSIGRQLNVPELLEDPEQLNEYLKDIDRKPIIILDALDEANDPNDLQLRLLAPIITSGSKCKVIVGLRPERRFSALLSTATEEHIINLDRFDPSAMRDDIRSYVDSLLREYGRDWTRYMRASFAEAVAAAVTEIPIEQIEAGPFLLAQLHTRHSASRPPSTIEEATASGHAVPRSVTETFRNEVRSGNFDVWIGPMLVSLAYSFGSGMTIQLASAIAARIADGLLPSRSLEQLTELISQQARFYLRSEIDADGSRIFSLFHQSLQDHLIANPWASDAPPGEMQTTAYEAVYEGIFGELGQELNYEPDWENRGTPYLRRHLGQHAISAGKFDDLVTRLDFLAFADPGAVIRDLRYASTIESRRAATIYRMSYRYHLSASYKARVQRLSLDAARFGSSGLHLSGDVRKRSTGGLAKWSTGTTISEHLLDIFDAHSGQVTGIDCIEVVGSAVAVSCGSDGTVRLWDLARGTAVGPPLQAHNGPTLGIACTTDWGVPVAASCGIDGAVRLWDLFRGTAVGPPLQAHNGPALSIACTAIDGMPVGATSGEDGSIRIWDLARGSLVGENTTSRAPIRALAWITHDTIPIIVSGGDDGFIRGWAIAHGQEWVIGRHEHAVTAIARARVEELPTILSSDIGGTTYCWSVTRNGDRPRKLGGQTKSISSLSSIEVDGRPVVVSGRLKGIVRVWDIRANRPIGDRLRGHRSQITAVASTNLNGMPIALSGNRDGMIEVWNLASVTQRNPNNVLRIRRVSSMVCARKAGRPVAITVGRASASRQMWDIAAGRPLEWKTRNQARRVNVMECSTLDDRQVVISGSDDGKICLWDVEAEMELIRVIPAHQYRITSLAICTIKDSPAVLTASDDKTICIWDLSSGAPLTTPMKGHTRGAISVAGSMRESVPIAVSSSADRTIRLWDLSTGSTVGAPVVGHAARINSVSCTFIGSRPIAVTAGADELLKIWNLENMSQLSMPLAGHTGEVVSVCCAMLDTLPVALSGGRDGSLIIWDIATGARLYQLDFPDPIRAVAISVDNIMVAYGDDVAAIRYLGLKG
ncbi:hypothetical protein AB0346_00690 [Nocardia beijingensis]|uniref:hypothetical protein n=1 Tax=Nocardia beijingensis TaxID=95162 RepID=UPI00344C29B9